MEGIRLPAPSCCPKDVAQVMFSCWREDPHLRPEFLHVTQMLCGTSILQNVFNHEKGGEVGSNLPGEERITIYTKVLDNTSMHNQFKDIKKTNQSYCRMEYRTQSANNNDAHELNEEEDGTIMNESIENETLQKQDAHALYCQYSSVIHNISDNRDNSDSGASTDHNPSVDNTAYTEMTRNSNEERWNVGRLHSLNEVEEEIS